MNIKMVILAASPFSDKPQWLEIMVDISSSYGGFLT
jgi:hypothetical protein